jgi:hypothetical protein
VAAFVDCVDVVSKGDVFPVFGLLLVIVFFFFGDGFDPTMLLLVVVASLLPTVVGAGTTTTAFVVADTAVGRGAMATVYGLLTNVLKGAGVMMLLSLSEYRESKGLFTRGTFDVEVGAGIDILDGAVEIPDVTGTDSAPVTAAVIEVPVGANVPRFVCLPAMVLVEKADDATVSELLSAIVVVGELVRVTVSLPLCSCCLFVCSNLLQRNGAESRDGTRQTTR